MRALVIVAAAVALLLVAAGGVLAQPLAKPKPKKPSASVVFQNGAHVLGAHFKPKERVTIVLTSSGTTWRRIVRAKPTGAFDIDLGQIRLSACNEYLLKVVGALGSHAGESHPVEPC